MRARGIDISRYQGTFRNQGNIDFVIVKATEGWGYRDPCFQAFLPCIMTVPVRGAYHYFRTEYDPTAQANHFYDTTINCGFNFLAVDYEKTNNTLDKAGAANLKIFWDHLVMLSDKPIVLYTSPYTYRDNLCIFDKFWSTVPLWMAHYNGQESQIGSPWVFDASGWILWQYTDDGKGMEYGVGSVAVDLDVYNGTIEEMKAWLKVAEVEDIRAITIQEIIDYLKELL